MSFGYPTPGNSIVPASNNHVVEQPNLNSSGFGVNNFLHGMHSFRSAEELQYYLNRIAGPGSEAEIRGTVHMRVLPTGTVSTPPNGSLASGSSLHSGSSPSHFLGFRNNSLRPAFSSTGPASMGLNYHTAWTPSNSPVPSSSVLSNGPAAGTSESGERNRRYVVLFCELHRPNSESSPSNSSNNGNVLLGAGAGGYAPARDGVGVGFCSICQSWMIQSGQRSITFPPPQP